MARKLAPNRDESAAQDATQEAFIALLELHDRTGTFDVVNLRNWLFGVVHNKLRDQTRRDTRRSAREGRASYHPSSSPVDPSAQAIQRETIRRALLCLDPLDAQLLIDKSDGHSLAQIAELRHETEAKIRTDLYRARKYLRALLAEVDWERP